jgi:hypothetical protein
MLKIHSLNLQIKGREFPHQQPSAAYLPGESFRKATMLIAWGHSLTNICLEFSKRLFARKRGVHGVGIACDTTDGVMRPELWKDERLERRQREFWLLMCAELTDTGETNHAAR